MLEKCVFKNNHLCAKTYLSKVCANADKNNIFLFYLSDCKFLYQKHISFPRNKCLYAALNTPSSLVQNSLALERQ